MSKIEELAEKWAERMQPDYGGHVEADVDGDNYYGMRACLEGIIAAALELAAQRIEAKVGSLAVSRDRAKEAGRETVAACRQSDIETCERMAAEVRALKSPAGPVQPSQEQDEHA